MGRPRKSGPGGGLARRKRPLLTTYNGIPADGTIKGWDEYIRKVSRLPQAIYDQTQKALDEAADNFVEQARAITPVSDLERSSGDLRNGVQRVAVNRDLAAAVGSVATDAEGRFIAAHVEYGHKTPSGGHVAAKPSFWPVYRVIKKRLASGIARKVNAAVKGSAGAS